MLALERDTLGDYPKVVREIAARKGVALIDLHAASRVLYRALGATAMIVLVLLAARLSPRPAFAAAFVGWNPLLAIHFAGGGHNDAWMMAFVLGALALAAAGRPFLAGLSWAAAIVIKWVPLLFLPLRLLEARKTGRRLDHRGLALGFVVIVTIATWRYGLSWLGAAGPLAQPVDLWPWFAALGLLILGVEWIYVLRR